MQLQSALREAQEQNSTLSSDLEALRAQVRARQRLPCLAWPGLAWLQRCTAWSEQQPRRTGRTEQEGDRPAAHDSADSQCRGGQPARGRVPGGVSGRRPASRAPGGGHAGRAALTQPHGPQSLCHSRSGTFDRRSSDAQAEREARQEQQQAASKAQSQSERHQEGVARLTGENLVWLLKLRQAEAAALSAVTQRDSLAQQLEQQRAPWYEQVRLQRCCGQAAPCEACPSRDWMLPCSCWRVRR